MPEALGPLTALIDRWLADLHTASEVFTQCFTSGNLSSTERLSSSVIISAVSAGVLLQVILILVTGVGRKQLLIGAETVIASCLLLCLLLLVLGLPLGELARPSCAMLSGTGSAEPSAGALFLCWKVSCLLLGSVLHLDALAHLWASDTPAVDTSIEQGVLQSQ